MKTVKFLTGGELGDTIVAGGVLQLAAKEKNERFEFYCNSAYHSIFDGNPYITCLPFDANKETDITFLYPSQYYKKYNVNIWHLHIAQRYSMQMGFFIDESYTLDIYQDNAIIKNQPKEKTVAINLYSRQPDRRHVPDVIFDDEILPLILELGYSPIFVGACGTFDYKSTTDLREIINILKETTLFIAPISGLEFIASCLNTRTMLFSSSVPYYRDCHFKNIIPIQPIGDYSNFEILSDRIEICEPLGYSKNNDIYNIESIKNRIKEELL